MSGGRQRGSRERAEARVRVQREAREYVEARAEARRRTREALRRGGVEAANEPERLRLRARHRGLPSLAGREVADGLPDFLDVRYLERGVRAQRAVARITYGSVWGAVRDFGTGFMVSPRLLLTAAHVLETREEAAVSHVEFDFQLGLDGKPLKSTAFRLAPEEFWMREERLDFALMAVKATREELRPFGFHPLREAAGNVLRGESVSIVQHNAGGPKKVVIRENQVVDIDGGFISYDTDTDPASSGAPVFDDRWEVVALHNATAHTADEEKRIVNRGTSVASLLRHIRGAPLKGEAEVLRRELLELGGATPAPAPDPEIRAHAAPRAASADGVARVPLEITMRLGVPGPPVRAPRRSGW